MSIETAKKSAESIMKFKNENIASIEAQYGAPMARVVDEVTGALFIASGIALVAGEDGDLITKLMVTDLTAKLVARIAQLAEKAHGMPEEQRPEAIELSKELHTKLVDLRSEG